MPSRCAPVSPSPRPVPPRRLRHPGRADADRPHRRGGAADRVRPRLPGLAEVLRQRLPPLSHHALIEFGNRALSGLVGVVTVVAAVLAFTRRPFRRDLALAGAVAAAGRRRPGRARRLHRPRAPRPRVRDGPFPALDAGPDRRRGARLAGHATSPGRARARPTGCRCGRSAPLAPLGALTIFAGTAATAAGPHAGGARGQTIHRLTLQGRRHAEVGGPPHATIAALFGVAVIGSGCYAASAGRARTRSSR